MREGKGGLASGGESGSLWADQGKRLIEKRYRVLSGVDEVCSLLGISASHFREVFYLAYHMTPKEYLDRVRIEKAKELLSSHSGKEEERILLHVAGAVGFRSVSTFVRTFKRVTGLTSKEFKNK